MKEEDKAAFETALFAALVTKLDDPFMPDSVCAAKAMEAARGWVKSLEELEQGDKKPLVMRWVG